MSRAATFRVRWILAGAALLLAGGCAHRTAAPLLYRWDDFPRAQYDSLTKPDAASTDRIAAMEEQANKASSDGAALPPGFRAHLGLLKLSAGDPGRARELWIDEKRAFPESTPYMDQLLKRLDAPAKPKDQPA